MLALRRRMLRWIFAGVTAMHSPAVEWEAPASCPSQAEIDARIAALGGAARGGRVVVVEEGGRFRARVVVDGGEERWLEAETCEAVAEAVGLVVAIGVPRTEIVEPPLDTGVAEVPTSTSTTTTTTTTTTTPTTTSTTAGDVPASRGARPLASPSLRIGVGIDGGITWRTVPRVGPSIAGGLAIVGDAWRVDVRAIGTTRTRQRLDVSGETITAQIGSVVGEVRGAFVPRVRIVEFPIGGGIDVGGLRARARGRSAPAQISMLLALVGTAGIAVVPLPWLAVRAEVAGVLALVRPRFAVRAGDQEAVWQTPYLGLRALLGLEFRFAARRSSRR